MRNMLKALLLGAVFLGLTGLWGRPAYADDLDGQLNISYSDSSGTLSATYTGSSSLGNPYYKWYRDGSEVATSREYSPSDTGTYTCRLSDDEYDNVLRSTSRIELYQVSGTKISLRNSRGLFEQGKTVTVSAVLNTNERVTNWKTNTSGVSFSSSSGSTVTFRMPASNVVITPEIKAYYTLKVVGGKADTYVAAPGDVISLTASEIDGKRFTSWVTTGGSLQNANNPNASLTMPSKNIQVTANFTAYTQEELEAQRRAELEAMQPKFSDPSRILFSLPWSNNYKVTIEHHKQGPYCDMAFKLAAAGDCLVLDYFNIIINDNPNIRETPTPITACVTLPADLQWGGRNWRVLCVSRGGFVYSFPDEDEDDTTVTFSPDRFYAFALCYNDNPDPVIEEPVAEEIVPEPEEEITIDYDPALAPITEEIEASRSESQEPSAQAPSASHSVTDSHTMDGTTISSPSGDHGTLATSYSNPLNVESDKQAAIRTANGARIATLPL